MFKFNLWRLEVNFQKLGESVGIAVEFKRKGKNRKKLVFQSHKNVHLKLHSSKIIHNFLCNNYYSLRGQEKPEIESLNHIIEKINEKINGRTVQNKAKKYINKINILIKKCNNRKQSKKPTLLF